MGTYRGKTYYIVGKKSYLMQEYGDKVRARTHTIVKLPDSNPDVKMGKGRYALLKK